MNLHLNESHFPRQL